MEKLLENLEEMKVENERGNKGDARKEPRSHERNRTTIREEFKNREKKWKEEKNNMSERVAQLQRKLEK
jgi:hypothetical protein